MNNEKLINNADNVKNKAYSPYYKFNVGASLLTKSGKVYDGCNIETGAGFSICAERVAFAKAISEGEKEFVKIAVTSDVKDRHTYPCGVCRQFISEFCDDDFIVVVEKDGVLSEYTMKELLPYKFKL